MKPANWVGCCVILAAVAACHGDKDKAESTGTASGAGSSAPTSAPGAKPAADLPTLAGFEGEIDLVAKGKTSPTPTPINLLVKNEVIRVDLPAEALSSRELRGFTGGGKVWALLKAAEKKATIVLDAKQQAIVIDMEQAGEKAKAFRRAAPGAQDAPPPEPPKVVKTGRKHTIAGYPCEDWDVLSADKSKLDVCVAERGVSFFHFPLSSLPTEHAWALELLDGKHFPMKGIAYDKDGTQEGEVEVTKLDPHTLDAALFAVPPGYKEVTLDEIMQGFGGGGVPGAIPGAVPGDMPRGIPRGPHGPRHHGRRP